MNYIPEGDEDIINYYPLIDKCKAEIERNARRAGLRFDKADIISVYDNHLKGTVIFLHRFNPEPIVDFHNDPVLDENGNPKYHYQASIMAIYSPIFNPATNVITANIPRTTVKVQILCPWLVRIVLDDGTIIKNDECLHAAFRSLEFI